MTEGVSLQSGNSLNKGSIIDPISKFFIIQIVHRVNTCSKYLALSRNAADVAENISNKTNKCDDNLLCLRAVCLKCLRMFAGLGADKYTASGSSVIFPILIKANFFIKRFARRGKNFFLVI